MTVGLPGTGIGGLYYLALVLLMPLREGYLTLRGRSSVKRWKQVGGYWCLLLAILGVLWGQSWLLMQFVVWAQRTPRLAFTISYAEAEQNMMLRVGQFAAVGSILILTAIIVFAWMLRFAMKLGLIKLPNTTALKGRNDLQLSRPNASRSGGIASLPGAIQNRVERRHRR